MKKLKIKTKNSLRATQIVNIIHPRRQSRPKAKTGLSQSNDTIIRNIHHYMTPPTAPQSLPVAPTIDVANLQKEINDLKRHPFLVPNNTEYFDNLRSRHFNTSSRKRGRPTTGNFGV